MYQPVKVGMFGLGTVGMGVVDLLPYQDPSKTGLEIELAKICVKDSSKPRKGVDSRIITTNPAEILENPEIDVVVEVMGGIEPAGSYLLRALENKKHVVTANKALLTHPSQLGYGKIDSYLENSVQTHGGQLIFIAARGAKRNIGFEASVCGEIPIISTVSGMTSTSHINSIEGIVNGTSNYILTRMSQGLSYEIALSEAQSEGFAEADASFDVDGWDAAQKLSELSTLTFGHRVEVAQIARESIRNITHQDIKYAKEFGYVIKPLAIAKRHGEGMLELRVCPMLVLDDSELASVNLARNSVSIYNGDSKNPLTLSGMGAGSIPTARSVVEDIARVVKNSYESRRWIYNLFTFHPLSFSASADSFSSRSYIRIDAEDKQGVLGKVATLIGKYVNIQTVIQKDEDKSGDIVPIVMLTASTKERNIDNAVSELGKLPEVKQVLRIRRKPKPSEVVP